MARVTLGLLVVVLLVLLGCSSVSRDEVEYVVSIEEMGVTAVDSAELMARAAGSNSTAAAPVAPPTPVSKNSSRDLSVLQVNRILLDGVPLDSMGHRKFRTERDTAFERGHEFLVEFDINDDVGDIEGRMAFTLLDYTLNGLPEGDTLARNDTLHLWWEPVLEHGTDYTSLIITRPPHGYGDVIYEHHDGDSTAVSVPALPDGINEVKVTFYRSLDEWYPRSDTYWFYYTLEGEKLYQVVDSEE